MAGDYTEVWTLGSGKLLWVTVKPICLSKKQPHPPNFIN